MEVGRRIPNNTLAFLTHDKTRAKLISWYWWQMIVRSATV